jgi:hypothetical protein
MDRQILPREFFDRLASGMTYGDDEMFGLARRNLVNTRNLTPMAMAKLMQELKKRRSLYGDVAYAPPPEPE